MKVLITNDDGINARGILALAKEISKKHEIIVVAPREQKSASSHSISIHNPIKIREEKGKIVLNLKEFNKQNIVIKKRIIIYAIEKAVGNVQNIEKVNIDDIIKLCEKNIGNKYIMPNKKTKILVNKGQIIFELKN